MYGTDHMEAAQAMDALERTRARLEKAYTEAVRAVAMYRGLGFSGHVEIFERDRAQLEEELTAVAVALDVLKMVRP